MENSKCNGNTGRSSLTIDFRKSHFEASLMARGIKVFRLTSAQIARLGETGVTLDQLGRDQRADHCLGVTDRFIKPPWAVHYSPLITIQANWIRQRSSFIVERKRHEALGRKDKLSLLGSIRKALDNVFPTSDAHDRRTRNLTAWVLEEAAQRGEWRKVNDLPNTSFEVPIVSSHDIDPVLDDAINQTVICICPLVIALDSFKSWVFGDSQGQTVFLA